MRIILKKYHPIPAILSGFFILVVCLIPGKSIPSNTIFNYIHLDKWIHAMLYFIWTMVWLNSIKIQSQKYTIWILFFIVFYGGIIELIQDNFVDGRSAEWLDWVADISGCCLAVIWIKCKK